MSISAFGNAYFPASLRPYFFLSHSINPRNAASSQSALWSRYYTPGNQDFLFVVGWSLLFIVLRWITMRLLRKVALWWIPPPSKMFAAQLISNGTLDVTQPTEGRKHESAGSCSRAVENVLYPRRARVDASEKCTDESVRQNVMKRSGKELRKAEKTRQRTATRFAEQGFAFLYYSHAWLLGLWVHATIYKTILETDLYWTLYPHIPIPGPVKFYYLVGLTFYSTQVIILNVEERRKDHMQMFTHHIVTVLLMVVSYLTNFTRVGGEILFILDWCDILLPLAKMSKYLSIPLAPDVIFAIFLISWLVTRQILFPRIAWAVTIDMPVKLDLVWNPAAKRYATHKGWIFFASSLWILQVLLTIWFGMACKVAYGVILGRGAEDTRSDDEMTSDETDSSESTSRVRHAKKS